MLAMDVLVVGVLLVLGVFLVVCVLVVVGIVVAVDVTVVMGTLRAQVVGIVTKRSYFLWTYFYFWRWWSPK